MSQSPLLQEVENGSLKKKPLPEFNIGDTVDVHVRIREGEKERVQIFSGTVIRVRGGRGLRGTFTVRRIVASEGVERVFPFHSPRVVDIQVKRRGSVRRAKLYYLRDRVGKATKVKELRYDVARKIDAKREAKRKAAEEAAPKKDAPETGSQEAGGDS